jgi:subtilase-type serine protease
MPTKIVRLLGRAATPFVVGLAILALFARAAPAVAQPVAAALPYVTLDYGTDGTFLTGIRGNMITGQNVIPGSGGATGGLLYSTTTQTFMPFPLATPSGVNYPGAIASTPYGPSFGSAGGILRAVGSYMTTASSPYDLGFLYDGAAGAAGSLTTLQYPSSPGAATLYTIGHSTFGNQAVGNYDTQLDVGHAFLYDIPTGTYTNIDKPGAISTTAYGVWGNLISGGYDGRADAPGVGHGFIYNETTGVWTTYDHPGAIDTHFEGIAGAGRAGTYNLVADWTGPDGQTHASILHLDAQGNQTWIELNVPGSVQTSANSMYGSTALGIYVDSNGGIHGYTVDIPGLYNPIRNDGALITSAANVAALSGLPGDDLVNTGRIVTSGANSPGISSDTYGVVTNSGAITVTGAGSAAVRMNGLFGTLLNYGTLSAAPGAYAIATGPTASGSLVVNEGTIDGQVNITAGPYTRFENSGWLGISAPGSGTAHVISGTFVQTAAGTLQLRVGGDGSADTLQVGTGRLAGALTLATQPGLYANQTVYSGIVSATATLTGNFATVQTTSPFLQASALPVLNSVTAVVTRVPFDALPGLTRNQLAVGAGLERGYQQAFADSTGASPSSATSGTASSADLYSSLFGSTTSAASIPTAYNSLSGEGLTGSQQTLFGVGSIFVDAIREQGALWLTAAPPAPGTFRGWTTANGGGGHLSADGSVGAAQLNFDTWGGEAGIDYAITPDILVGIALGGSGSNFSVSDRQTNGTAAGGEGGVYALGRWDGFYAAGTLAYGRYNVSTTRTVSGFGLTAENKGSFDAGILTGRLESGYTFATPNVNVTPFLAYQPSWIALPGYSESAETGTSSLGLAVQSKTATSQPVSLGVQVDRTFPVGEEWSLTPMARAAWVHEFATERSLSVGLQADPAATFQVQGAPAAGNAALLSGTFSAAHGQRLTLLAGVYAGLSGQSQVLGGHLGVQLSW